LQSIGFATLMVISVLYHDHWSTGWLRNRVAAQIGVLSYSIYIWQQLFCTTPDIFGLKSAWILSFPQWIPAAFFCGAVSYCAVELPFLKLKRRFEKRSALAERNNSI
jgi:peptidoglycan/LPS O-acetylase OafA/YrhL